ncbi:MAG: hypothetical protein JST81_11055 [Bacteroidetes bacterium]|nr:hypothetical protein [Bacteroidota bacterium]
MRSLLSLLVIVVNFSQCTVHDPEADYSTSDALAYNLIETCVNKTLDIHAEFNTDKYLLDLKKIPELKETAVDSFFFLKNNGLNKAYEDSLIVLANNSLSRSRVLDKIIVRFTEVEYINKKHVYVKLSKIRSANQVIKIGLDLERNGNQYRIFKTEIRR